MLRCRIDTKYKRTFNLNDSSDIMNYYSGQGAHLIAIVIVVEHLYSVNQRFRRAPDPSKCYQ